jgi:integrase/recombinase XerD
VSAAPRGADLPASVTAWLDALWLEGGASAHTRAAYATDLRRACAFLVSRGVPVEQAGRADLLEFLAAHGGRSPRTLARRMSALRGYYRHLVAAGMRADDPTLRLEPPRRGRALPRVLSQREAEALLEGPAEQGAPQALALRDRAMLELLYATGLRVSELVGLTLAQLDRQRGVVRVLGKGRRERLVPYGEAAAEALARYLAAGRPALLAGRSADALFVTGRGAALTRQAFWLRLRARARATWV